LEVVFLFGGRPLLRFGGPSNEPKEEEADNDKLTDTGGAGVVPSEKSPVESTLGSSRRDGLIDARGEDVLIFGGRPRFRFADTEKSPLESSLGSSHREGLKDARGDEALEDVFLFGGRPLLRFGGPSNEPTDEEEDDNGVTDTGGTDVASNFLFFKPEKLAPAAGELL